MEIPTDEPILITYYITKWVKDKETFVDFNINWAGVLTKGAVQDPILETSMVSVYAPRD